VGRPCYRDSNLTPQKYDVQKTMANQALSVQIPNPWPNWVGPKVPAGTSLGNRGQSARRPTEFMPGSSTYAPEVKRYPQAGPSSPPLTKIRYSFLC